MVLEVAVVGWDCDCVLDTTYFRSGDPNINFRGVLVGDSEILGLFRSGDSCK